MEAVVLDAHIFTVNFRYYYITGKYVLVAIITGDVRVSKQTACSDTEEVMTVYNAHIMGVKHYST